VTLPAVTPDVQHKTCHPGTRRYHKVVIPMPVRSTITTLFQEVAREQQRQLAPLTDDLKLLQCGLDSLSFALIVARLEDALGYDPFDTAESFPVTFGDFVKLYEARAG
jgi:acyl carrier protein